MTTTTNDQNSATLLHLSSLTQYCIPFGNFIFPIIIWSALKEKSAYVDAQGKECLNFQISLFVYSMVLAVIAVPALLIGIFQGISFSEINDGGKVILQHLNSNGFTAAAVIGILSVVLFGLLWIAEFFLVIYAAVKTAGGADFKYPLTIRFIK